MVHEVLIGLAEDLQEVLARSRFRVVFLADPGHAPGRASVGQGPLLERGVSSLFMEAEVAELSRLAQQFVAGGAIVLVVCSSIEAAESVHCDLLASPIAEICHYSPPEEQAEAMHARVWALKPPYVMTYCEEFPERSAPPVLYVMGSP